MSIYARQALKKAVVICSISCRYCAHPAGQDQSGKPSQFSACNNSAALEARANKVLLVQQIWNIAHGSICAAVVAIIAPYTDVFSEARLSAVAIPVIQVTSARAAGDAFRKERSIAVADVIAKKKTFAGLRAVTGQEC